MTNAVKVLDATGLLCPLPVLRARKALRAVSPGGIIEILVTDPAAPEDFRAFCHEAGHTLVKIDVAGEGNRIRIKKRSHQGDRR